MSSVAVNLSTFDVQRLEPLIARNGPVHALPEHLNALLEKLNRCVEVPPVGVPPYIVTMNSEVRLLDLESGKHTNCTLVFPLQADINLGRVSVLAPLGAALLGSRVGATLEVSTPRSLRRYRIEQILFQPEAAGKYDL
ncbi:MAG TPA: GreA/GreB family elongation factor [Gammaproteobacteria bacterium]